MDLTTSTNQIKLSFKQICSRSLLSLKQVPCACFEPICEAMLESMNFAHKTFVEQFRSLKQLLTFWHFFQNLINFAIAYKYTKAKLSHKIFLISSLRAELN